MQKENMGTDLIDNNCLPGPSGENLDPGVDLQGDSLCIPEVDILESRPEKLPIRNVDLMSQEPLITIDDEIGETIKRKKKFMEELSRYGFNVDDEGIYVVEGDVIKYLTNFSNIEFLYSATEESSGEKLRYIKIDQTTFTLRPTHLLSSNSFNKLLLNKSNFRVSCTREEFLNITDLILKLDNEKIVKKLEGFGKVDKRIYNSGNIIIADDNIMSYKEIIWLGKDGFLVNHTNDMHVDLKGYDMKKIWKKFHGIYDYEALLIIGFAVAGCFFKPIIDHFGSFPIFFLTGESGSGKSALAELIARLYGAKSILATVNCETKSTTRGIEQKSLMLKNLPLILDEMSVEFFHIIKSRHDGQGSIIKGRFGSSGYLEKTVNGSTIVTSEVMPFDYHVISRCIFFNLDDIKKNKHEFDRFYTNSMRLSRFAVDIIKRVKPDLIIKEIERFRKRFIGTERMSRVIDNYSLIGGALNSLIKTFPQGIFPSEEKIFKYLNTEMEKVEKFMDPLHYFLQELFNIFHAKRAEDYMLLDENHLFINLNGVWNAISVRHKMTYLRNISENKIKKLLVSSDYIEHYSNNFPTNDTYKKGKPVDSYVKKIRQKPQRCVVLKREKLPKM